MLKKRYGDFLKNNYQPENIYAYSTNMDRTKESLKLVLAGLLTSKNESSWDPNSIAIHSFPPEHDKILCSAACSRLDDINTVKILVRVNTTRIVDLLSW